MNIEERLAALERAVFTARDDFPTGHASLQEQLDELFHTIAELRRRREPVPYRMRLDDKGWR